MSRAVFAILRDEAGSPKKASAILAALKSESFAIAPVVSWRPAATAPKGENILTWDGKHMAVVRYCVCAGQWERPDDNSEWVFTQWRPLPEPPR